MFKKFLFLTLVSLLACTAVSAQQPPAPGAPATPRTERRLIVFGDDDGGYLGIMSVAITNDNFAKFGLREARGVGIEKVMENSPASQAGLQNGDVILRFDGEEVKSTAKLSRLISEVAPDQKVRLTISRSGGEQEITATVGKRAPFTFERMAPMGDLPTMQAIPAMPTPPTAEFKLNDEFFKNLPPGEFPAVGQGGNFVWNFAGGRKIGVMAESLTKQLGENMGVSDGKGLLLMEVRENSPAAKAGLKAGDIITEVDGTHVSDSMGLVRAVNVKKEGDVEITFIRDKDRRKVKVTPEQPKEGELPTLFQTAPGANGDKQTFVVPSAPAAPNAPVSPQAIPALPAIREIRRVI